MADEEARKPSVGGDYIQATIGDNASQVAVGKNIAQDSDKGAATGNVYPDTQRESENVASVRPIGKLAQASRIKLRENMYNAFTRSELRDVCFDMDVDYESLSGDTKGDDVRELIALCERSGRINELITMCSKRRSNVSWEVEYE
jgi:hypothetical protein